jgi:hypothetical protein
LSAQDERVSAPRASRLARMLELVGRALAHVPRLLGVAIVVAWMALIWTVSAIPAPNVGGGSPAGAVLGNLGHAPEFGLLTLWVCLVLPRRDGWVVTETAVLRAVWLAVVVYACVDEVHQALTPHRDPSVLDVLTDGVAAAIVLGAVRTAGGRYADGAASARWIGWGALACLACAALATFVPALWPRAEWL